MSNKHKFFITCMSNKCKRESFSKVFLVHDILHPSLLSGKSSSFPSGYFAAVKTRFSRADLSLFQ